MNIGQLDTTRLSRAYQYLVSQDNSLAFSHSVSINSFIQMNLSRLSDQYTLNVFRPEDCCFLSIHTFDRSTPSDHIVDLIQNDLVRFGTLPKCLICTKASSTNGYCDLCNVMSTCVEDTCAICLDESRKEAVWVKTECNHTYHYECYKNLHKACCPLCRGAVDKAPKII